MAVNIENSGRPKREDLLEGLVDLLIRDRMVTARHRQLAIHLLDFRCSPDELHENTPEDKLRTQLGVAAQAALPRKSVAAVDRLAGTMRKNLLPVYASAQAYLSNESDRSEKPN
jgi:hypothetical protein